MPVVILKIKRRSRTTIGVRSSGKMLEVRECPKATKTIYHIFAHWLSGYITKRSVKAKQVMELSILSLPSTPRLPNTTFRIRPNPATRTHRNPTIRRRPNAPLRVRLQLVQHRFQAVRAPVIPHKERRELVSRPLEVLELPEVEKPVGCHLAVSPEQAFEIRVPHVGVQEASRSRQLGAVAQYMLYRHVPLVTEAALR